MRDRIPSSPHRRLPLLSFQAAAQAILFVLWFSVAAGQTPPAADPVAPQAAPTTAQVTGDKPTEIIPWEYRMYQVPIWIVTDQDERLEQQQFHTKFMRLLDLEVEGSWDTKITAPPARYEGLILRDLKQMNFDAFTADDWILAVDGSGEKGRPVRTPQLAADLSPEVLIHAPRPAVAALGASADPAVRALAVKLTPTDLPAESLMELWKTENVVGLVIPRSLLVPLAKRQPAGASAPRVVELDLPHDFMSLSNRIDKLIVLRVTAGQWPMKAEALEIDGPMRFAGPVVSETCTSLDLLPFAAARAVVRAFSPVVRIEGAQAKTARGRVRAGGLLRNTNSPVLVKVGETLQPWLRKDDRAGKPSMLGPLDWTYGVVKSLDGPKLEMDVFSGRSGGLDAKVTRRTQRVALRVRKRDEPSVLRLHARGNASSPMAGYEVFEKDMQSGIMSLVGRTDWDGRFIAEHTDSPVRLLYIKNGGSVLARLPMVPGLMPLETADLVSDDMRLHAEAYLKGVENSIIDLVATRQLLAARIRSRIQKKQLDEAQKLFEELRSKPSYKIISDDMSLKQRAIQSKNTIEQKKIDTLFAKTRELLVAQITDKLINDLQKEIADARGG